MRTFTSRSLIALALLAALSPAFAAKVKIGVIAPTSGPLGPTGEAAMLGARLALDTMKADLSRAGLDVSFVMIDEVNPTVAAQAAAKLAQDPEVLGVLGPTFSGAAMLVSDALKASNVTMVSGSATAAELTDRGYGNVNRVVARGDAQGAVMADYLNDHTPMRRVLVVSDNTTYGNSLADDFQAAARALTVVGRVNTSAREGFGEIIAAAKDRNPQVIYYSGGPEGALGLIRELRQAKIGAVVAGGSTFEDPTFVRGGGALLKDVLYTSTFGPMGKFSGSAAFVSRYRAAFDKTPNVFSFFLYDATRALLTGVMNAARRAPNGMPSRADVSSAVRRVSLRDALTGPVAFNAKGDRQRAPLFVMKFDDVTFLPTYVEIHIARPK